MARAPAIAVLPMLVLAGCLVAPWTRGVAPAGDAAPDAAERRLTEAALRADASLAALARVRMAENPLAPAPSPRIVPTPLLRKVTLDWTGPLEALVRKLAAEAGYGFVVAGTPPVRPLMITIVAENKLLVSVLRDVGVQAGTAAALVVDAERKKIWLDWAPKMNAGA